MLSNILPPENGIRLGERREVVQFLKGVFNM
jgi:hypothetical protein